ncbi:unnamed protein product, partial [Meganyctiphanes norvegica]
MGPPSMNGQDIYEGMEYIEDRNCVRSQFGCLCGLSSCRLCCRVCPSVFESTSTRLVYIFFLLINIAIMALMMSQGAQEVIMEMFPDHTVVCKYIGAGSRCESALGYVAVYRLGFAFTIYHFLLMLITCVLRGASVGKIKFRWVKTIMYLINSCVAPVPCQINTCTFFIFKTMHALARKHARYIVVLPLLLIPNVVVFHAWMNKVMLPLSDR